MPPAAPAPATRASREAEAARRWARISAAKPDLEPAVALQRRLLAIVIDLTDTVERGRLPRLSLPPKYLAAKLARGVPAFAGEPMPLPIAALAPSLPRFCRELAQGGAGDAAEHIRAAIDEGRIEGASLLAASFKRDQQAIRTGAGHRGLAPDLVWLIAELAVSPFAHVLQHALLAPERADPALAAARAAWNHGYCPACGSWPALAEVADGHRVLRCSFCAHAWEMTALACAYCGGAGDRFVTVAPLDDRTDERVEVCGGCGGYLKTVDVAGLSPFPLLAIADLETMELDMKAMERGYRRPPLREFGRAKG